MFGWLFKKQVAKSDAEPFDEKPPLPVEEAVTPVNKSVETPAMPVLPPLPPTAPDDWTKLLDTPAEALKLPTDTPVPVPLKKPAALDTPSTPRKAVTPTASVAPSRQQDSTQPLQAGMTMRAIPEKQPATPRGWNVKILKTDAEGVWVVRVAGEDDPLPVAPKEVLSLVTFDERRQLSYDCPVIRIKTGNPEQVLVGWPLKSTNEKSKLDSLGGRQHFRIELQMPIEVRIPGLAGRSIPPLSGHTRDVSKGGVALTLTRGFDIGRELEVKVLSWNFPLQIKAKVVRCHEEANGRFTVAVAFPDEMSAVTRDLVAHFILENQRGR